MPYVPYVNELVNACVSPIARLFFQTSAPTPAVKACAVDVQTRPILPGRMLIRLAGISGAMAVIAGAYGAHGFEISKEKEKRAFQTGAHYHLIHSVALLGSPLASKPYLTASLFVCGITMFCGGCYYAALSGDERFNRIVPVGGMTLIFAWLSFMI